MKRTIAILIGITLLATLGITASAETVTDPTGDVYRVYGTSVTPAANKPNVDITEITYNDDGATFTLTMTIDGTIQSSDELLYFVEYVSGSISYHFVYMSGHLTGIGTNGETDGDFSPVVTVSEDTFTVVFTSYGVGEPAEAVFQGWVSSTVLETGEGWWDYAPDTYAPWHGDDGTGDDGTGDDGTGDDGTGDDGTGDDGTGDDGTGDDGTGDDGTGDDGTGDDGTGGTQPSTPGFETIAVIGALAVTLIILRKRK